MGCVIANHAWLAHPSSVPAHQYEVLNVNRPNQRLERHDDVTESNAKKSPTSTSAGARENPDFPLRLVAVGSSRQSARCGQTLGPRYGLAQRGNRCVHRQNWRCQMNHFDKLPPEKTTCAACGSQPTKYRSVLCHFLDGSSFNRFEAHRIHDFCLHSTIATLRHQHGIEFDDKTEKVPCLNGTKTVSVSRYWLRQTPENLKQARALLGSAGSEP
jgi:hypothetical protein